MIGIYQDNFIDYLKDKLGDHLKITSKNIVIPCPFCEYQKEKDHYHMYISLEAPIFHCFHASCEQSGTLRKFLRRLEGHDISETFVDKKQFEEISRKKKIFVDREEGKIKISTPKLNRQRFVEKEFYIKND